MSTMLQAKEKVMTAVSENLDKLTIDGLLKSCTASIDRVADAVVAAHGELQDKTPSEVEGILRRIAITELEYFAAAIGGGPA